MKNLAGLLALALASMALVACGSDDGTTTTTATDTSGGAAAEDGENAAGDAKTGGGGGAEGGESTLEFEAAPDGGLAYTTNEVNAEAGKVTIDFKNPQSLAHDVVIEDPSGEEVARTEVITNGADSTATNLDSGEYTFYCSVPGHREAGMEGTLNVE